MIKVVVDCFGADQGVSEVVKGAVQAINEDKQLFVCLAGDQNEIQTALDQLQYNKEQVEILNASEGITNDDVPTQAIRTKKDSSLVVALNKIKSDEQIAGLVSAGSTGAVLTGAFMKLGRIKGVSRPGLCPALPTKTGSFVHIMDCGANLDCKPINLVHFALMGHAYLKNVFGIEKPRIGLLNVGVEDKKGNELLKEVFPLLKQLDINFIGNVEARELMSGDIDLVVCDGFAGNVLLKGHEGAVLNLLSLLKSDIKSRTMSKIGAVFMSKTFKQLKKVMDYNNHGGAVFIGCKSLVVKAHGSSKYYSIYKCINQVKQMHQAKLIETLEQNFKGLDSQDE